MSSENSNVLFVLNQNEIEMNAVKSSNLSSIFRNIIFVEEELYTNEIVKSVIQPVGPGGFIKSIEKIKTFIEKMKTKDNLKDIPQENFFILTVESLIDLVGEEEKKETCELAVVHLCHKEMIYHSIGVPAKFPEKYATSIKNSALPVTIQNTKEDSDNKDKEIFLGFDKTISSIIMENEDSEDWNGEWVNKFNSFSKVEQYIFVINQLNYVDCLKNITTDFYTILQNPLYRNMLKVSIVQKFSKIQDFKIDYVVGIEKNGYCIGILIAEIFNLPFVPIKYSINLNGDIYSEMFTRGSNVYNLEMNKSSIVHKSNILIVDDIIDTPETINAAQKIVKHFEPSSVNVFVTKQTSSVLEQPDNLHVLF
jgi:adenine/guanine phosphoribosyltransferase-like PRPP-binding protein